MKKKPELELFSPTQEGIIVPLSKYLKQMTEFAKTEWSGIAISENKVKEVWKLVAANSYIADHEPNEIAEMFEKMSADLSMAEEMEDERLANPVVEAEEVEVELTEDEPVNESLALVESVKNGLELSSFTQKFDIGSGMTQCVPRGQVEMKDWVAAFAFGLTLESGAQWIIGDSVVALENAGHEDVVNQLCSNFKKSYPTVSGYARACRAFPADKRDATLPFTVYREIGNANFGDESTKKQNELLEAAKNEKLSSTEVRNRVRSEQGKDDKPSGHRFLLLNVGNFSNSEVLRSMPEEVQEHQLLIDLGDKSWFDPAEGEWLKFLKEA
jgi:phosphoribosylformylglycinamidine (FGAM) synthase PurS component